ncbi:MAG: GAF domain-containing protein [Cyanosarcina radialis HA8281-LM2]|jgi:twitching motility protein PilJ|nr:GAF domain-containing protein [Cyanosarcina radialis HA8281-LM2]
MTKASSLQPPDDRNDPHFQSETGEGINPLQPSDSSLPSWQKLTIDRPPDPADSDWEIDSPSNSENSTADSLEVERGLPKHLTRQQPKQKWGLKAKVAALCLAIGIFPGLAVGAIHFVSSEAIKQQILAAKKAGQIDTAEIEKLLAMQQSDGLMAAGLTTLIAGGIAALLGTIAIRPVLQASALSTRLVNRLGREDASTRRRLKGKDELVILEHNINALAERFPDLLWKQEAAAERIDVLLNITHSIQKSLSAEDALRTATREIRKALRTDRVAIFRFDSSEDGTIVEESVAPGLPKMLWAKLSDPCLSDYIEPYRQGRVRAINDIYNADLNDCHIGLLERFAVKANLVAPIIKDNQLFGLLIANHCSSPRLWQDREIDLFAQLATQVGFALDYARLLERAETKADRVESFVEIARRLWRSLNQEDILQTTVEEVRKTIAADRTIVYAFDENWYGTVIAESVVTGFPKTLRANIKDPCFAQGYLEQYQAGRIQAVDDVHRANLSQCHLEQLADFGVKANLVAPILSEGNLFGLLIAHQCARPRQWQQSEIDLFAQLATQVGFALDCARTLERLDAQSDRTHLVEYVTRRIRESADEERLLETAVEEVRKAMRADRAVVYSFNRDWSGQIVAESVLPNWPHALDYKIEDACIPTQLRQAYRKGRVVATNNVFAADFHPEHLELMERLAIQANLVTPILLQNGDLLGLLIVHQCSSTRYWQPHEIDFCTSIAAQVGFALDRARALSQAEQAYRTQADSQRQQQNTANVKRQLSALLADRQGTIDRLSVEVVSQMESVKVAYHQIQALVDLTERGLASVREVERQKQRIAEIVQLSKETIDQMSHGMAAIQDTVDSVSSNVKLLGEPAQQLIEMLDPIAKVAMQLKLQAMNIALEAARNGEGRTELAAIAQKVLAASKQLEADVTQVKPLVAQIQAQTQEALTVIESETELATANAQLLGMAREELDRISSVSTQIATIVADIGQTTANQTETLNSASQAVMQLADIANQNSEKSFQVSEFIQQLLTLVRDLEAIEQ